MRRSPASSPSFPISASSTRWTMWRGWASRPATSTTCSRGLSDENVERVKRQNKRKISVIIGNPPYNANQANENDNNKNREYPRIDELHQVELHPALDRAEDQGLRHVCPVLPLGDRPHGTMTACWRSSPTAASSTAAPSTAFARRWRRSSTRSMWSISAATCAPTRSFRHQAQCLRHPDRRGDFASSSSATSRRAARFSMRAGRSIDTAEDKLSFLANTTASDDFVSAHRAGQECELDQPDRERLGSNDPGGGQEDKGSESRSAGESDFSADSPRRS